MHATRRVSPYRESARPFRDDKPATLASDERLIIIASVTLGSIRIFTALMAGKIIEAEVTLALFMLVGGTWSGSLRVVRRARRWSRHRRILHDRASNRRGAS
jgi:hypothetical protein